MGRPCLACHSPSRERIDVELAGSETYSAISKRYRISPDSLKRHKAAHLSPALTRVALEHVRDSSARGAADEVRARLLEELQELKVITYRMLALAEDHRSYHGAAKLIAEGRQNIELYAKLEGLLSDRPAVAINVLQSPEVSRLISTILTELAPWPEVRVALADRLEIIDAEEVHA